MVITEMGMCKVDDDGDNGVLQCACLFLGGGSRGARKGNSMFL
jgi:hypothetical protein